MESAAQREEVHAVHPLPPRAQLKRFQHTAFVHRKLGALVTFPMRGLDLGAFLARAHPANAALGSAAATAPALTSVDGVPVLLSREERQLYDLYA